MLNDITQTQQLIQLAGIAQIALVIGSLAVPGILNWKTELNKVSPLIKQIFWVYAAYIATINLSFGLVSTFCARDLANSSTLATLLSGFIAVYWISRLSIQFFCFDRANFPTGKWHKVGEFMLVSVFIFLTVTYSYTFYFNLMHHVN